MIDHMQRDATPTATTRENGPGHVWQQWYRARIRTMPEATSQGAKSDG
jgi:hypothetical protein